MNERQAAEAIEAWLRDELPELVDSFAYLPARIGAMPTVAVEAIEKRIVQGVDEQRFPFAPLQQADLRVIEAIAVFYVDSQVDAEADEQESQQLQHFGDVMERALLGDATLGERVQMASPYCRFDYSRPFVQYPDGTRARQMVANIAVAELVQTGA